MNTSLNTETAPQANGPSSAQQAVENAAIAPWLRALVTFMDDAVRIPGTNYRIGFDAVLGALLPGAGDAATATSHLALLLTAFRLGVPRVSVMRMLLNIAIDVATGVVPLVGDLFDVGFKANRRNLQLLEAHTGAGSHGTLSDHAFVWGVMAVAVTLLTLPLVLTVWLASYLWK